MPLTSVSPERRAVLLLFGIASGNTCDVCDRCRMLVVIVVLVPIHNAGGDLARQRNDYIARGGNAENLRSGLNSKLMRSTAANLNEGDPVMWIHVVLTWLITLYAT